MTVLVDFKAAFPSVNHQYMMKCLTGLGAPAVVTRTLVAFYANCSCKISDLRHPPRQPVVSTCLRGLHALTCFSAGWLTRWDRALSRGLLRMISVWF